MSNTFNKAKMARRASRGLTKDKIHNSMRSAGIKFDLTRGDDTMLGNDGKHAYTKAIELVADLFSKFTLPSRPQIQTLGIVKHAMSNNGQIESGIIKLGAVFKTLLGHKTQVDIPVVVNDSRLLEPSLFFLDGAPYIICQASLDQLVKHGTLEREVNFRRMFQPPVMYGTTKDAPRRPIVNLQNMYSPGARSVWRFQRHSQKIPHGSWKDVPCSEECSDESHDGDCPAARIEEQYYREYFGQDKGSKEERKQMLETMRPATPSGAFDTFPQRKDLEAQKTPRQRTNIDTPTEMPKFWPEVPDAMLDPAERSQNGLLPPGAEVKAAEDIELRERGGAHLIVPKGEEGIVLRDMEGGGVMLYVNFPAMGVTAPVPQHMLKTAGVPTVDQVRNEIRDMLREGYQDIDIRESIKKKYPTQAEEALQGL